MPETAPEHRAAHLRPLQAQGRSCHLFGRCRSCWKIIARPFSTGELQPQHEQRRVVGGSWDTETYYSRAGRWKVEGLAGRLSERYSSVRAVP